MTRVTALSVKLAAASSKARLLATKQAIQAATVFTYACRLASLRILAIPQWCSSTAPLIRQSLLHFGAAAGLLVYVVSCIARLAAQVLALSA